MERKRILWVARFGSAFASSDWKKLKKLAARAKTAGFTSKQLYELTLQGYLFLGFPAAIEAFTALEGSLKTGRKKEELSRRLRVKKGEKICRKIYREKFPILMQSLKKRSPELAGWIIEEGYGKVLSRPGASLLLRELFAATLLAATGFPKQLFAHLRALVEMGEKPEDLSVLVRAASGKRPRRVRGSALKTVALLAAHRHSVWKVPASSR